MVNQDAGGCQASVNAPGVSELFETATEITFAFGANRVGGVVAGREQRLVGGRREARPVGRELRVPERPVVRVVPDRHVVDLRVVAEQVGDEGAVLGAGAVGERRVVGGAVDADHDADAERVEHEPLQRRLVRGGHLRLAGLPLQRDPDGLQADRACDRRRLLRAAPEQGVLVGADEEARRSRGGGRGVHRGGEHADHGQRQELSAQVCHYFSFIGRTGSRYRATVEMPKEGA